MAAVTVLALVCGASAEAAWASSSGSDTLFVAEREDHSPFVAIDPASGHPVVAWVASAPDTNPAGPFDEVALATYDGSTWSSQVVDGPGDYFTPKVAYSSDGAQWLVWVDHDGTDSQLRVRRDLGGNVQLFELGDPAQPDLEPAICPDDAGGIVVAWQGWRTDNYEILLSRGDANGFGSEMLVSQCANNDREPAVAWGNGKAWIVWSCYQNMPYNFLLRTYDGVALSPEVQVSSYSRARALTPAVCWDDADGLLWIAGIYVNHGWAPFNQYEKGVGEDLGTPTLRAYDGTTVFAPAGVDSLQRIPTVPMETLGYERPVDNGVPLADRHGSDTGVLVVPGRSVWVFHKQLGAITEYGRVQRYWGAVGTTFGGATWSAPGAFLDLRTSFGWEAPAVAVSGDKMWVALAEDDRSLPVTIRASPWELFGHDMNIVVESVAVDTTDAGPPSLVSLGSPAVTPCTTSSRPQFVIDDHGTARTLLYGDMHRHSADISWDAAPSDPFFRHTIFYSQDWLGHDFLMPSDHVQTYSKAMFRWVVKWAELYDVPDHYTVFPGYERIMVGPYAAGGHQNVLYRDPADFTEASALLANDTAWQHLYDALSGIDALSVPHTTAQSVAVTDWDGLANGDPLHLPDPLRLVEVYQAARQSFEYPGCPAQYTGPVAPPESGWVNVALAMGMRLGLMCSSDHTGRAAYVSVFATENSRDAIYQALWDRHCFGSSRGVRFNCDFRVNGELMGSEIQSAGAPRLDFTIEGPDTLTTIEVNKDGNPSWMAVSSSSADTTFSYVDPDPIVPGTSSFYYLRVIDAAGNLLWTSPVWVDFVQPTDAEVASAATETLSVEVSPNPSSGAMRLALRGVGPLGGRVRLYDVAGRLVRAIDLEPGPSSRVVAWDGRTERGHEVSPGVYFAVVQSGGATKVARAVTIR